MYVPEGTPERIVTSRLSFVNINHFNPASSISTDSLTDRQRPKKKKVREESLLSRVE